MKRVKRTEITFETTQVFAVRFPRLRVAVWCAECAGAVQMVTPEEAAAAGLSTRAIYRQVESGQLHFTETPDGRLYVCLDSLAAGRGRLAPDLQP